MSRNILVVDCGSTGIRTIIVNSEGRIVYRNYKEIDVDHPEPGATENNPETLWLSFKEMVIKAINRPFTTIESIAITNQRSTFTMWDKDSGEPVVNFINWQDVRAADTARIMNKNPLWVTLRTVSFLIGRLIRNPLLTVTSMLRLNTDHTITKVRWLLNDNPELLERCKNKKIMFGTIDSWLLYKLTDSKVHGTDFTNAAATTMLNPFMMKWNDLFCGLFNVPMDMLPAVYNNNENFGNTSEKIFGKSIPVTSIIGDQQASLFGHRCFKAGEVKVSLGSGAFICMNVGEKPKFSLKGLFPMIGWNISGESEYILEGQVATVGTYINWVVKKLGLFESPQEMDRLAAEAENSGGVIALPTLTGIRYPYFKPDMTSSFYGMTLKTEKKHIARAIIDGIAHRICDIIEGMEEDTKITIPDIKTDGGVSNSDILMQRLADLTGKKVYRSVEHNLASLGAAYIAGLTTGVWKNKDDILKISIPGNRFKPSIDSRTREEERQLWKKEIKSIEKNYKS